MENKTEAVKYGYVSPGTAGVAQRVESKYSNSGEGTEKEKEQTFCSNT